MSKAEILQELPKLKPEEREEVRAKLNELDDVADEAWIADQELTADEKAMLDARLAQYENNPDEGSSWEEVEARLRTQLKKRACGSLSDSKRKLTFGKRFAGTNKKNRGLGWQFGEEVHHTIQRALGTPRAYRLMRRKPEVRRIFTRRFPYRVFYVLGEDALVVFAVIHGKRQEAEWIERL